MIISFLVTGEDNWENKAQKESDYYTTDWKFHLYNVDIVPSEALNHALHIDFFPKAGVNGGIYRIANHINFIQSCSSCYLGSVDVYW